MISFYFLLSLLCCAFCGLTQFAANASLFYAPEDMNLWNKQLQLQETMRLLFPNRTALNYGLPLNQEDPDITGEVLPPGNLRNGGRDLGLNTIGLRQPYLRRKGCTVKDCELNATCNCVRCVKCTGLKFCTVLNDFIVQETYYPDDDTQDPEKCKIIDQLGERLSSEIFGNGRTFRDTTQCREIVMQYLCLFYGSHNPMYTNYCYLQEEFSDAARINHRIAPRAPCRGFCVQVMTTCANNQDMLVTCGQIACPPIKDDLPTDHWLYDPNAVLDCTSDPFLGNENLDQKIGCKTVYDKNPYFKASGSTFLPNVLTSSLFSLLSFIAILR